MHQHRNTFQVTTSIGISKLSKPFSPQKAAFFFYNARLSKIAQLLSPKD